MPAEKSFPAAGATNITGNQILTPNAVTGVVASGNVIYSGNKTLTLNGPGIYVFNSFQWTGNSNKLVLDFKGSITGIFYIYVWGNTDFGKLNASVANGNSTTASRIFLETHGDGLGTSIPGNSFIVANGSSGGGSKWMGSVYASRSGINIGSGTGSSSLTGTFLSPTQITLQSGVTVNYAPFSTCWPPDVTAGISINNVFTPVDSIPLDFTGHTTLTAVSTTSGVSFSWQATKGGTISSNANSATITASAAGTYIVSAYTTDPNCISKDTIVVTAKLRNIIGGELLSIYQNYDPNNPNPEVDSFFVVHDGYVTIDIICKVDTGTVSSLLRTNTALYGLTNVLPNGLSKHTVTGDFPIIHLLNLNARSDILNFCKPYYLPSTNAGIVISQGDSTMRSYLVRKGYGLDGAGIKIGVISDSYNTITDPSKTYSDPCANINQTSLIVNTAAVDIINGDLPNVTVIQDFPFKRTDEGRAMMQIVHDVAPGAQKYFKTGFFTAGYLAKTIEDLAALGIKVSTDDVTYADQPMLKDGVVAKSVNKVKALGVLHVTSAGNFAGKSYEKISNFVDATSIGFPGKKAHNFGNDNAHPDFFQKVWLKPGSHFIVLQWLDNNYSQDELAGTQFDVDFFLTPADKTDGTGLIGFNRDNLLGDAVEFVPILIAGNDPCDTAAKAYNILIVNNTITGDPVRIKYVSFKGGFRVDEYNEGNSTIVGHANADGAFTVGAARFNHVPGHPLLPAALSGITKPQIESFSSIGGTMGKFKPNIVGPDGGDVTVLLGGDYPLQAPNNFPNFFGTSAAAPHVAAAAALVIQARDKFLKLPTSPDQVISLLQSTAVDMRPPGLVGYDFSSGAGLIDVDAAIRTFASPTPFEISLVKAPNIIPCQDPFELIIKGENFSDNTKVYLVNAPGDSVILTPTYISETKDTIKVIISTCSGNPQILAYTAPTVRVPPVVGGAEDGGFSNSIKLFNHEIVVQTLNVSRKYGEVNPVPATTVTFDGVLVTSQTTPNLAALGLDATKLNLVESSATPSSDVGTYAIKVYRTFDPANATDLALTNQYSYVFKNGLITINKMPLTVTPNPITVIDGQPLGNVTFNYAFDHTNVPGALATTITNDLKAAHEAILPNNALAVIKDFATSGVNISALNNMNAMASFRAIKNSRKFTVDATGQLVPVTDPNTFPVQYFVDVAAQSIIDYIQNPAVAKFYAAYPGINKKALLGGTALDNNLAKVNVNNVLEPIVNGTLAQTLTVNNQPKVPIFNNELVQIVNGELVQFVNGELEPIVNQELVQIVNNELVQIVNGTIVVLGDLELVRFANNALVMMVNSELVQVVNGIKVNAALEPIVNSGQVSPVLLVNNELVQIVNGELHDVTLANNEKVLLLNNELVQIVNNELVQIVNGELVQVVNNTLEPIVNQELVQIVNGQLVQIDDVSGVQTPVANNQLVLFPNNELVQMVNGQLKQFDDYTISNNLVNGTLEPFVNGDIDLVQIVNNELVQIVNGELVQVVNNTLEPIVNQELVQIVNNQLVQYVNGVKTAVPNNQLVLFPNNELVQMVNSQLKEFGDYTITNNQVNGTLEPFVNYVNLNLVNSELVQIVNNELVQIVNGVQKPIPNNSLVLFPNNELVQIVNNSLEPIVNNGLEQIVNSGLEPIVNGDLVQFVNSNTTGVGNTNNNTAVIIDEEDVNVAQHNWLGPMFGINMITGLGVGTNYLIPGKLVNPNFDISYGRGTVTVSPNPCLLTHSTAKNLSNTPVAPTSMWLSMTTKVSGQLNTNGDYLLFKGGTVTFNFVNSTPAVTNSPIPDGKIIADNTVLAPVTSYDATNNIWITKVPVGFASTSDIFITGKIINSSNGFVKLGGNTSSVVKGMFYSTKNFSDQWGYGLAAYQPQFNYGSISAPSQVQSINGTYRAGTPIPVIATLVGGGNSYTGTSSSFDNFTACQIAGPSSSAVTSTMLLEETQASLSVKEFQMMPNPASDNITLSFVPLETGTSTLTIYTIDGRKVFEFNNGSIEAGKQYTKKIDVSKYKNGVYLIRLQSADKATVRKFMIAR
jgi:hypothetical protein